MEKIKLCLYNKHKKLKAYALQEGEYSLGSDKEKCNIHLNDEYLTLNNL